MATIDDLLTLQQQQLDVLRTQGRVAEQQFSKLEGTLDKAAGRLTMLEERTSTVVDRLHLLEAGLNGVISTQHQTWASVSTIEARMNEHGKRLSELNNKVVKLEDGVHGVDGKIDSVQHRCAEHSTLLSEQRGDIQRLEGSIDAVCEQTTRHETMILRHESGLNRLNADLDGVDDRLSIHEGQNKQEIKEVTGRIVLADMEAEKLKVTLHQTWKTVGIAAGVLATLIGLIIGFLKVVGAFAVLAFLFSLTGCSGGGLQATSLIRTQTDGETLNTTQPCTMGAESVWVADAAAALSGYALHAAGYAKDTRCMDAVSRMRVCLVLEPEACSIGGMTAGPWKEDGARRLLAARKAGCASAWHAWASVRWPPVCRPDWLEEPHCVPDATKQETAWPERLRHEVFNMLVQRCAPEAKSYMHPVYTTVEPIVQRAFSTLESGK